MKKNLFLSMVLGLIIQFFYSSKLPDVVAFKFETSGLAVAGMLKEHYMIFTTLALLTNSIICLLSDRLFRKIPTRYFHFPHKKYWLTEQRKDLAFTRMAGWTDFFGILINLFLILLFLQVFIANTVSPPELNMPLFFLSLVLFVFTLFCWLILLYLKFKPPTGDER